MMQTHQQRIQQANILKEVNEWVFQHHACLSHIAEIPFLTIKEEGRFNYKLFIWKKLDNIIHH